MRPFLPHSDRCAGFASSCISVANESSTIWLACQASHVLVFDLTRRPLSRVIFKATVANCQITLAVYYESFGAEFWALYTLPVSTGRVHGREHGYHSGHPCRRAVIDIVTSLIFSTCRTHWRASRATNTAREHGCPKWHPCSRAVSKADESEYRALMGKRRGSGLGLIQ